MKKFRNSIIVMIVVMLMLVGCGQQKSNVNYQALLDNASKVTIKEAMISLGKEYDVYVNGQQVAEVHGKIFKGFGDTFTLTDENGNILDKEKQVKRWGISLNRSAVIEDAKGNVVGYIGEQTLDKFLSFGYVFHFYDKNRKEIGKSNEVVFSLLKQYKYSDNDGQLAYQVNANLNLFKSSYTLTVKDKSQISLNDAILMVCIQDAIYQADKENKSTKKK